MSNQAPATRPPTTDLRIMIQSDKMREQLAMALPHYYTPDQFTVIVRTAINKNPKLADCDPGSFMTAMVTAAQMGLAPDGRNGHLIPRYNGKTQRTECTFQPDYKGLVNLVRKNENVADIYAEPVHEADIFRITKGLHRDLIHEVDVRKPRGPFIGAYSVISYKDSTAPSFEFMSKEEIDAIKARSQSANSGPWVTDYSEMAKKTVIKRLLKLADLSQETVERLNADTSLDVTPSAQVVEIKQAAVPERPALTDSQVEPEPNLPENPVQPPEDPTPQPEPQPEPKAAQAREVEPEKRGPGRPPKKLEKKPAQDDPKSLLVARTREALAKDGFSEGQLVQVMIANEWGKFQEFDPATTTADDLELDTLESLFEGDNWETIVAELKDLPK